MQHYSHLDESTREAIFASPPHSFSARDDAQHVGSGLGACLYMPGTRPQLADDVVTHHARGLVSTVWCLEDSISESEVPAAQANIVIHLAALAARFPTSDDVAAALPLIFVRVRTPQQLRDLATLVNEGPGGESTWSSAVLAGFVMPKFTGANAPAYFDALAEASALAGYRLLAMPVVETPGLLHRETRGGLLSAVSTVLAPHRDVVACVRIGGTDLGAALGLRRPRELTIYNIGPVADVVYDIVNVFGRTDGTGFPISGPVWECFANSRRLFKPMLRETPFRALEHDDIREELLEENLDGLVRELALDRANGLTGKTIIHPQHVGIVHALSVVSSEEHADAVDILAKHASGGGVQASSAGNKMNEAGPHRGWAERTMTRAELFGVARPGLGMVDFLLAHVEALSGRGAGNPAGEQA
ncbi:HpcH/HpaI aldolase/citrate lyase family protein [Dermacoccus sp. Ellin185]|uniref:HpcH/HpaI aldolase/citrate lyase family protein n=1 Tax=Dermacoccus sp. Ellin185 TaxID=188626 RepID=UPI0001E642F5|nr:HpcH/HpaI aldolase/citrate lyase family protein [Dermacoccus sp. Ellin185]EFP58462.1 hypothetical protein HMPREF0321_0214 [Dermacoccus sp. Ellin185]